MSLIAQLSSLRAVGIAGSPGGASSRSRVLLAAAVACLRDVGLETDVVDLAQLPAEALLRRSEAPAVERAVAAVAAAHVVVVATPVYRASYSGLLKVFFDLLDEAALADKVAVPIAAGGGAGHLLAIDHGLRPLLSSLGATVVPGGVYATPSGFVDGAPGKDLLERIDRAVMEAVTLTAATVARRENQPIAHRLAHPFERQVRHARAS